MPKQSLQSIQSLMLDAVRRPLRPDESMQSIWRDGSSTAEVANGFIKPNDRLTSFDRLQIYNQQYWWRLIGTFAEDFRGLRAVIGDKRFDRLTTEYLQSHPSQSWTLRNLGRSLPEFLKKRPELTAPHTAAAVEMSKVEWARVIAFDDAEHPPLDPQKLAGRDPAKVFLKLQPYISLLELQYPIDTALGRLKQRSGSAVASNAMSGEASVSRPRIRLTKSKSRIFLAVHRMDFSVYYKRLEPWSFALLQSLQNGDSLADACNNAFAGVKLLPANCPAMIQDGFAAWTRFGWFQEI